MPAIVEHIKKYWVWYAGGAALLVAFFYLRSRQAAPAEAATGAGNGSFGAGATSPSAPATGGATSGVDYQGQLNEIAVNQAAQEAANRQAMFGLQFGQLQQQIALSGQYAQALLPSAEQAAQAQYGAQAAAYGLESEVNKQQQKQVAKTGISCPGNASARLMPDASGNLVWQCRQKTSGGILGIPVGQIFDAISNALGGVQAGIGPAAEQATVMAGQATGYAARYAIPQQIGAAAGFRMPAFGTPPFISQPYAGSPYPAGGGQIQLAPLGTPIVKAA